MPARRAHRPPPHQRSHSLIPRSARRSYSRGCSRRTERGELCEGDGSCGTDNRANNCPLQAAFFGGGEQLGAPGLLRDASRLSVLTAGRLGSSRAASAELRARAAAERACADPGLRPERASAAPGLQTSACGLPLAGDVYRRVDCLDAETIPSPSLLGLVALAALLCGGALRQRPLEATMRASAGSCCLSHRPSSSWHARGDAPSAAFGCTNVADSAFLGCVHRRCPVYSCDARRTARLSHSDLCVSRRRRSHG